MALVGAIDQGTTSTRFMVFDHSGRVVAVAQRPHAQHFAQPGWVEHDALEILGNTLAVVDEALTGAGLTAADLVAVGIANQRETTVVWDRATGEPVHNAIVWQDTRTAGIIDRLAGDAGPDRFRATTGLPLATYFAGPKIAWMLDEVPGLRERAEAGDLCAGTIDSWLLWNLTGGTGGGRHATDVTNASRTLLMDLETLDWDQALVAEMGIPASMLPEVVPSIGRLGTGTGPLDGVPVSGILGDQQAALFGQGCHSAGEAKNTYGTGCFLLMNTGTQKVPSTNGLLTTVACQVEGQPATYALEGSVAMAGATVQWLRDQMGLIADAADVEALARTVDDNGDVYLVPAFSGLFAPHWRSDARGVIVGLTRFANRGHIARAALESTAFQAAEQLDAMRADSGVDLAELRVDGGMVGNDLLMQFQADLLGVDVVRPVVAETTALGAAYAAGLAEGFWEDLGDVRANWQEGRRWEPAMGTEQRDHLTERWRMAVERTMDWV
ncbi:MAG: glycerol kinase GlpK [Acidimicrobiales bacterium]|jgi:glycerol kinase|nr:glycerol kinase GlpK [Acidimicrobiales bacterium]